MLFTPIATKNQLKKNPKSHLAIILTDKHQMNVLSAEEELLGTLTSDDGNGNSTKAIGLITKTTILHVHAFLYISLPSLHDNEISSLFLHLAMVLKNSTLGWFAYI